MAKRECTKGHAVRDRKATHCPQCGEELPPLPARKKWPIVVGILGAILICGVIALSLGDDGEPAPTRVTEATVAPSTAKESVPTKAPASTKTPIPSPTPKPIADLAYTEIREKQQALTDAQWKAYVKPLIGLRIQWTGYVEEVKENGELRIDMDPPSESFSTSDVYFRVPKEDVLEYDKDQELIFQGDIKSVTVFLTAVTVTLEDTVILGYTR